ncbi:hypothetical protein H0H92_012297 [Tricholoma furcatifolium]|nr:hypothetical protein H0H92_012297 [Tricholoma furcatifolium]
MSSLLCTNVTELDPYPLTAFLSFLPRRIFNMVSKKLMGAWAALDVLLLAAGVISLTLSIVWRAQNLLMNMVLTPGYLTTGAVLGIAFLITFAVSIGAIVQKNHVTIGLVILNYTLVLDALGIVVIGTYIWFFTLRERNEFHAIWAALSSANRITLQDQFQCCGYFNGTDLAEIGGSFCTSQDFVNSLNTTVLNNFCVTPITSYADSTLNNIFTYGEFISDNISSTRQEDERFKKIDAKRGGKGFV